MPIPTNYPNYVSIAQNTNALTSPKTAAGVLGKVILITVNGASSVSIFDNASAASGTVLFTIPASATAGSIYDLGIPVLNGITVQGNATAAGMTITFA